MDFQLLLSILNDIPAAETQKLEDDMDTLFAEPAGLGTYAWISVPRTGAHFYKILQEKVDARFEKDSECYHKAGIDWRYFNNYINGKGIPSRENAFRLAIALKLPLEEAEEFLAAAGYAFRPNDSLDVIVKEHITQRIYDPYEINDTLYHNGLPQLFYGGKNKRKKSFDE